MLRKNLWIVALLAVIAIVFAGCPDTWGDFKSDYKPPKPPEATDDLIVDDAEEIGALLKAVGFYGSTATGMSTDGNTAIFDIPSGGSSDNFGFELLFPEGVEGFLNLEVTFKLTEVTSLPGGAAKIGFKSQITPGTVDVTPHADHEVVFGTTVGTEKTQNFSLSSPNKLPNNVVYFSHNKYGDGDKKGADPASGNVSYKIAITKLAFLAGEPVPCCTDCDTATCKDCSADACTGACGTACCLNFNGGTTTKIEVVGGKVVHTNPPVVASEGGAKINANGTVTMNNYSLIYYKFPADTATYKIADYDYIDIYYTLSNPVNSATVLAIPDADYDAGGKIGSANRNKNLKIEMRDYKLGNYSFVTGGRYMDFGRVDSDPSVSPQRIQTWGDNGTGGFTMRMNSYDVNPAQGNGSCAEFIDIKIDKIEFSKGTRVRVRFFDPMGTQTSSSFQVLSGNSLGSRFPAAPKKDGLIFRGWSDEPTSNPGDGNPVTSATTFTTNLDAYATWEIGVLDEYVVETGSMIKYVKAGDANTATPTTVGGKDYYFLWNGLTDGTALASMTPAELNGYTPTSNTPRLGVQFMASFKDYAKIVITYDAIKTGLVCTDAGCGTKTGCTNVNARQNLGSPGYNDGGGQMNIGYPDLEAGNDKTYTIKPGATANETFSGRDGVVFTKGHGGSGVLVRITKVEYFLEDN